jgi:hypothetical protein
MCYCSIGSYDSNGNVVVPVMVAVAAGLVGLVRGFGVAGGGNITLRGRVFSGSVCLHVEVSKSRY